MKDYIKIHEDDNVIVALNEIKKGEEVCNIVSKIRGFKTDNKLSLKTKLEKVTITTENVDFLKSVEQE